MSNGLPDKNSGSSSDDDEANVTEWINSSGFDPKDTDFQLRDDDNDFGDFAAAPSTSRLAPDPVRPDAFANQPNLTAADWNSSFKSSFTFQSEDANPFADGADSGSDEDEWGAFSGGPAIVHPFEPPSAFEDSFSPDSSPRPEHDQPFDSELALASSPKEVIRPDGLVSVTTSDGATVVVPADEVASSRERTERRRSRTGSVSSHASS
jgi:hypothetical protein